MSPPPPPPPQPADAPLLPLAASYYDDEEEEEAAAELRGGSGNGAGNVMYGSDYSSDSDLSEDRTAAGRRHRQVELRRDCPYLDTVNRQVVPPKF